MECFDVVEDGTTRLDEGGDAPAVVAQFVYDGLGRCVKRTLNGVETVFLYDGWKPIAEWYAAKPDYFQAWNVYGPGADEILLRQQGDIGYVRFHSDPHGNVAFLVDNDGSVLEKCSYDAFGKATVRDPGPNGGRPRSWSYYAHGFLFQGREYIKELGIYDYRNRFYHPETGRFLQIDPTGFDAGDMNLFRYCGDDPIDQSDPLGLDDNEELNKLGQQARTEVEHAAFGRNAKGVYVRELHDKIIPSKMVAVLHKRSGHGYEKTGVIEGRVVRTGTTKGGHPEFHEVEELTKDQLRRVAYLPHSHNNIHGPATAEWSRFDEDVGKHAVVDRVDESNPKWQRIGPSATAPGYKEMDASAPLKASQGRSSNSSNDASSGASAADIDKDHQATGVPSLGAEAINFAPGPQ